MKTILESSLEEEIADGTGSQQIQEDECQEKLEWSLREKLRDEVRRDQSSKPSLEGEALASIYTTMLRHYPYDQVT